MTDNSGTDFFDNIGGGGAPSALLKNPGHGVIGEVVRTFKRDYIPFGKKDPEKNQDGSIRQQLVIVLQTDLRNWEGVSRVPRVDANDANSAEKPASEDDGKRAIYVPERSNAQYVIGDAVASSGVRINPGVILGLKVVELRDTGQGNPMKVHEAVLRPAPADSGFFPAQSAAPAAAQATAPAAAPTEQQTQAAAAQSSAPAGDPWGSSQSAQSEPPF